MLCNGPYVTLSILPQAHLHCEDLYIARYSCIIVVVHFDGRVSFTILSLKDALWVKEQRCS